MQDEKNKKTVKMMRSKDTRQVYRVIREYRHVALVTRADREKAVPFTMPREWLEEVSAKACADEILAMSKKGIQQAEPRAIAQFLVPTTQRVEGMAARAARILNKVICPGRTGCLAEPNPKRDHGSGKIRHGSSVIGKVTEPQRESHASEPTDEVATAVTAGETA